METKIKIFIIFILICTIWLSLPLYFISLISCKKEKDVQQTQSTPDCQANDYGWIHFHTCPPNIVPSYTIYCFDGEEYGSGNPLKIQIQANISLDTIIQLRSGTWTYKYAIPYDPYDKIFLVTECDTNYSYICY